MQQASSSSRHAPPTRKGAGDVIFEFVAIGNSVKVSAVDTATMREVSIVGPVSAGEAALRSAALSKLKRMLERDRATTPNRPGGIYA